MKQTQTKTSSLTDELRSNAMSGTILSPLDIARIKREIKAIKKGSAAEGYMLEGMLASLQWNVDGTIASHEKSLKLSTHPILYSNYIASMGQLLQLQKAYDISIKSLSKFPSSQLLLETACNLAFRSGNFEESIGHFEALKKLLPDGVYNEKAVMAYTQSIAIIEQDLPTEKFKEAFSHADSMMIKHRIQGEVFQLQKYDGEWNMFVNANTSPEKSADMNDEICAELAKVPGHSRESVSVIFTPAS